jgi:hypothetical protein
MAIWKIRRMTKRNLKLLKIPFLESYVNICGVVQNKTPYQNKFTLHPSLNFDPNGA